MDEDAPKTEPSGALVPPRRNPPTAVGLITPGPPPRGRSHPLRTAPASSFLRALNAAFDVLDGVADTVAEVLRLRPGAT